jgi:hypothetical protein
MKRLLREPLLHFLILGAGIFVLFSTVGDVQDEKSDRIVVSAGKIENLVELWKRTWQRPPTQQELEGLIEDHIKEEVLYREALALGLNQDDTIIRRRLRQKLEFLTDDIVAVDPTEEQLRSYFAEHPDAFRLPARLSFEHVYLNRDRRGKAASKDAAFLLTRLNGGSASVDPAALGDTLMLPGSFDSVSEPELARQFGKDFVKRLAELPIGPWSGPVESGYGLHIVRIRAREQAKVPPFEDVRQVVEREWQTAHRKDATEAFYQELRARYEITVERPDVAVGEDAQKVAEARR